MSFQLPATTTASGPSAFSFGAPQTTAAGGSTLGAAAAVAPKPGQFSFGLSAAGAGGDASNVKPPSFGVATAAAAPSTGPLGGGFLGAASTAAPTAAATAAPSTNATATTASSGFSFGAPAAVAQVAPATTATPQLTLAKTTAAPLAPATSAPTSSAGGFASLSTATKTTDSAAVANVSQLSYNQLEEYINKWTLELEEQEKVFTDQATQINAWDKILINNNQKILELNDAVQKVKGDQQTLEQELEFIATQHQELEESIVPLQKEFLKIPQVDVERSQTYLLVENLDTQLKQMSEDLKEIIDNLNEANKGQDNSDPIIQIGKILNAHMTSLQWIESSSNSITNKLDEITKMHDAFKRESERSFRSAYYN